MISDPSHRPVSALRQRMIRALIATLTYSFARVSAALKMKVEDLAAARRRMDDPAA